MTTRTPFATGGADPADEAGATDRSGSPRSLRISLSRAGPFLLLLVGTLLAGCASPRYTVTEGSHKRLPNHHARLAVWGLHPVVTDTVVAWLRDHGFAVVDPTDLQQAFDKEGLRASRSFADEHNAVQVAKRLGIDVLILTQSALGETPVGNPSATAGGVPFPGSTPIAFSSASVSLRGIEVASGELVLSATARYPHQLTATGPHTLAILACQALETAWGLRPPGERALAPDARC